MATGPICILFFSKTGLYGFTPATMEVGLTLKTEIKRDILIFIHWSHLREVGNDS